MMTPRTLSELAKLCGVLLKNRNSLYHVCICSIYTHIQYTHIAQRLTSVEAILILLIGLAIVAKAIVGYSSLAQLKDAIVISK